MQRSERREGVRVEPLRPPAPSILIVEVAAGISIGREHHRRASLARINRRVELLHADARLEHTAAADDRLIRHARQHVVVPDVRGHRLRIERVQAGVSGLSRRHHRGSGEPVRARDHPIGARERFEALELRIALERRQAEYPRLAVLGLHRFEQADLPFHDRSAERDARRPRFDASELTRPPPQARLEIVHGHVPGVACPLRFNGGGGTRGQAELGRVGGAAYLHRADRVDRQLDRILAGDRIGAVGIVERQTALIAPRPVDVQQAVRTANDTGNQRQRILEPIAGNRRGLHDGRRDSLDARAARVLIDDAGLRLNGHFFAK